MGLYCSCSRVENPPCSTNIVFGGTLKISSGKKELLLCAAIFKTLALIHLYRFLSILWNICLFLPSLRLSIKAPLAQVKGFSFGSFILISASRKFIYFYKYLPFPSSENVERQILENCLFYMGH